MIRFSIALAISLGGIGTVPAASPDPKDLAIPTAELARARRLVKQLGSEDFQAREEAQAELAKMGRLARPALVAACTHDPNPEIRTRSARLLPRAEAHELKARIDTFLADTELAFDHDLPGWNEFRVVSGAESQFFGTTLLRNREKEKAARALYVEMLENDANRSLLVAVGGPLNDLGALVANRKTELYSMRFPRGGPGIPTPPRREIAPADVLALMFAESQVASRYVPSTRTASMSLLVSSSGASTAFHAAGEAGDIYRAIAGYWIDTRDDPMSMYQALSISSSLNLPEPGKRLAVRLLDGGGGLPTYRAQAIVTLVRFDAREHLPTLERLLNDRTATTAARVIVNGVPQQDVIQMRDLALAAAVLLTDQKLEDYGYVSRYGGTNTSRYISYTQYFFPADTAVGSFARRSFAFSKWAAWRAEHIQ